MNCFTVFKRTGTHADTLAAIGAADVLKRLEPRIVELEDRFEIQLRRRMLPSQPGVEAGKDQGAHRRHGDRQGGKAF